jgi:hypothetical protein
LGSVGAVLVRLKPKAASLLFGSTLDEFTDVNIPLGNVFGTGKVSLLEEALAEAQGAVARAAALEDFLTGPMHDRAPDLLVRRAVLDLLRDPDVLVRQLASPTLTSARANCRAASRY